MSVAAYRLFVLPWTQLDEDDGLLRKITRVLLVVSLVLGLAIPFIPVPEEDLEKVEELPPRLAQLLLEKQQPKPKPAPKKVEKKKEEKKEEKKKEEKKKEKPKPKEKTEAERIEQARKKAASTGLLAFSDELADLRDTSVKLNKTKPLSKGATAAKTVKRNILTGGAASSGGIDTSQLSSGVGRSSLEGRETTQVESPVDMVAKAAPRATSGGSGKPSRTYEEVSLIFDRNKGAIYSLYSRALRKDPTLQGKVVLEITIDPSGRVTACKVVSSELNNAALERKLVARVKLLNFGAKNVDVMIVTYPIDFLPS